MLDENFAEIALQGKSYFCRISTGVREIALRLCLRSDASPPVRDGGVTAQLLFQDLFQQSGATSSKATSPHKPPSGLRWIPTSTTTAPPLNSLPPFYKYMTAY